MLRKLPLLDATGRPAGVKTRHREHMALCLGQVSATATASARRRSRRQHGFPTHPAAAVAPAQPPSHGRVSRVRRQVLVRDTRRTSSRRSARCGRVVGVAGRNLPRVPAVGPATVPRRWTVHQLPRDPRGAHIPRGAHMPGPTGGRPGFRRSCGGSRRCAAPAQVVSEEIENRRAQRSNRRGSCTDVRRPSARHTSVPGQQDRTPGQRIAARRVSDITARRGGHHHRHLPRTTSTR